jgi:Spy/CpxP family protein refolding chaperone
MRSLWTLAVAAVVFGGSVSFAQEAKKETQPAEKKDDKAKGQLPMYWKQLGLTDEQVQKVYKLQAKYNDEIDTLEAKIKELKEKMAKERSAILTTEQKKRLADILKEKAGADK